MLATAVFGHVDQPRGSGVFAFGWRVRPQAVCEAHRVRAGFHGGYREQHVGTVDPAAEEKCHVSGQKATP